MRALYIREIRGFLNSLVGYISIAVFLIATGLFLWFFQSAYNILDYGEASLSAFFEIAPFIFLFLIPAITMRMFSEEKRTGTIELLLTKPITDFSIIFSKFLAGTTLVFIALLPTLVYYYTLSSIGNPVGNIDHAGTLGAYLGLFLLGAVFVSIGVFASSVTSNQVVAFLYALITCFIVYVGFQFIADSLSSPWDLFFIQLSVQEHYLSLQKGVIDSRDILYYISIISLFILLTKVSLQSRNW